MGTFPWRGDDPRPGDDTEDNGNEGTTHLTLSEEKVIRQVGGIPRRCVWRAGEVKSGRWVLFENWHGGESDANMRERAVG